MGVRAPGEQWYAHLHDGAIKHANDIMIVGICLVVLAPITYVVRGGRRTI